MKNIILITVLLGLFFYPPKLENKGIRIIEPQKVELSFYDKYFISKVNITMYHPVQSQTDDTPDIVADGTKFDIPTASKLRWVAVSRDLHKRWGGKLSFGDIVYLDIPKSNKKGYYRVKDTMNKRWVKKIDILESPGEKIYKFQNVKLFLISPKNENKDKLWARLFI